MNSIDCIKSKKANEKGKRLKGNWLSLIYHAVKALGEIAEQLGKKDWKTNVVDPCINESSWLTPKLDSRPLYNNSLICDCSYPNNVCHVVAL